MPKKAKKHYKKPCMKKVKLVAKEAVLAGCKTWTAGSWGSAPPRCKISKTGAGCLEQGS